MRKFVSFMLTAGLAAVLAGCSYIPSHTNLTEVEQAAGMSNVTTGDGTFENYTATGHHKGTEIGIAVGIPMLCKIMELYPVRTNEELLTDVANDAKAGGAEAMINVTPHEECYTGFPFFLIGVYVDRAAGTGIDVK